MIEPDRFKLIGFERNQPGLAAFHVQAGASLNFRGK
jgi:hypothetical protein